MTGPDGGRFGSRHRRSGCGRCAEGLLGAGRRVAAFARRGAELVEQMVAMRKRAAEAVKRARRRACVYCRQLPPDYQHYLQTLNGGRVDPRGIAYRWTAADAKVLTRFLSPRDDIITEPMCLVRTLYPARHDNPNINMDRVLQNVVDWAGRPGLLPIAGTSIGDYIVMDLNDGPAHGSVHYMTIHGVAELDGTGIENPRGFIAPSFSAFTKLFFDLDAITKAQVAALMEQRR